MSDALRDILRAAERCSQSGKSSLAVFDIDSTLLDLRPRIHEILQAFARDPAQRAKYPVACAALATTRLQRKDWGLDEPLRRVGLQTPEHDAFFSDLQAHWSRWFFSVDYLEHDELIGGALGFTHALHSVGANILYLTAREEGRMLGPTEAQLRKWKFPLDAPRARLRLKPDGAPDDAEFKADALVEECARHERIWFFENEPVNLMAARRRCPQVELVFVDTNHSGREEPWDALTTIPHFEADFSAWSHLRVRK